MVDLQVSTLDIEKNGTVHGTAVGLEDKGLLIIGPSGSGKSGIALALMAHGARLIGDDRVVLRAVNGQIGMRAPPQLAGMIEARGLGVLNASREPSACLTAVLDMTRCHETRLPDPETILVMGHRVPLLRFYDTPYFHFGLLQYLRAGRRA